MPGKYGSSSVVFLIDGYDFLAAKLANLALKISSITDQVDGLGDPNQAFAPIGEQKGTLTQGGALFDTASLSIHDAMATKMGVTPQDTPRVICVGVMGNTVGAVCYGIQGAFSVAYEAVLNLGKMTRANAEHLLAGLIQRGSIVQPAATFTADWNTHTLGTPVDFAADLSQYTIPITSASKAAASVVTTPVPHGLTTGQVVLISGNSLAGPSINAQEIVTVLTPLTFSVPVNTAGSTGAGTGGSFVLCSTVNGGAGFQEVMAFSGFTGYVGKIRHSADETTYADLATFTNVTAGQKAERVAVAPGTTINRYTCHDGDVTGSGSITAFSMFARS